MKVIKEGIANLEKAIEGGAVINPVMAAAEVESEKYKERTEEITKAVDENKPNLEDGFTGAEKQPVPKAPELPKFELDEDIFDIPEPKKVNESLKESFDVNSNNVWSKVEEVKELLGEEEFLDALLKAMGTDSIIDYLEFICKQYDIDSDEDELEESTKLTEGKWNYTLKNGKALRDAIESEDPMTVADVLVKCYEELRDNHIIDEVDFEEYTSELYDIEPDMEDDLVDIIDFELEQFYDLCDNLRVWVSTDNFEESLTEEVEHTYQFLIFDDELDGKSFSELKELASKCNVEVKDYNNVACFLVGTAKNLVCVLSNFSKYNGVDAKEIINAVGKNFSKVTLIESTLNEEVSYMVVDKNGKEIISGDEITDFRGDKDVFDDITRYPEPGKEGKIYTKSKRELYPSVFGLKIVKK